MRPPGRSRRYLFASAAGLTLAMLGALALAVPPPVPPVTVAANPDLAMARQLPDSGASGFADPTAPVDIPAPADIMPQAPETVTTAATSSTLPDEAGTTTVPETTTTALATTTTTTVPPPTTTSTSSSTTSTTAVVSGFPRWVAGHESGNLSEWSRVSVSGDADARVTDEVAHSGQFSNALTIRNADGGSTSPGVRMAVEQVQPVSDTDPNNLPAEAFYSVYYYFPQAVDSTWWNLYQWKQAYLRGDGSQTRHPVYTVNAELRSDGSMYLKLRSKVGGGGEYVEPGSTPAQSPVALPIGSWVHLECFYRWSQQPDGRISCWQDGVLLWDVEGVITEFDLPYNTKPRQWTVNNYADDTSPATHTIYIDDAAISSYRIGPS